jgi:PIN domain nuclease of toxin-antitoxin system
VIVLADTHACHWWLSEPERLSPTAGLALSAADEVVVASITWYELAWLARKGRIGLRGSIEGWLHRISQEVRTLGLSPAIAAPPRVSPRRSPATRRIG